ncbi:MAG TPA: UDP-3-O-(3-hydroxymyristoyl)glucosamine N-acyltransferase [Firmicutes bacterium]|jgi:acetyltransferase-like isoleucine patch superfamily enzyme|nr:UDP-3-O-(3-hydroxymyristoyl)glucosamine N-acyltransferase [Bacillota bacterium]HCX78418.1 UDP-3-O-(3-hydroxymyristoyl)glucosamine N-acyltransferase [Bacillota bacterium]
MKDINPRAKLGKNIQIGNFSTIGPDVEIGERVCIGNNVTIYAGTVIGEDVRIDDNTVIGKQPMRAVTSAISAMDSLEPVRIGKACIIGTGVVIYRGCQIGDECLVADLATIREHVIIGNKTIIGRNVAIENHCRVGDYCKLETNSYITAWSDLGDFVFIAPGVITSNDNFAGRSQKRFQHFKGVTVKDGGRIGANATVLPGRTIEEQGFAAAGAVVTRDVPARTIVVGSPAKVLRPVPADQLLSSEVSNK